MREYGLYIDGKTVASADTFDSLDPSSGEIVARAARASRRDARRAIDAARRAFDDGVWSERTPVDRAEVLSGVCDRLMARVNEIADVEARDAGIPIRVATAMVAAGIEQARALAGIAARIPLTTDLPDPGFRARNVLVREPYGVAAAIVPFNAPFVLTVWKAFPALATGNTVVLKPSPHTPCSAMEMAAAFAESDVPPGVFNVLPGGGPDVGEELVGNALVDRVAFTGSTETGRRIQQLAAPTLKKVTLELGGKSANILLDDADLDVAVPGAVWGAFLLSGQTCQAGSRVLVPARLYDEVVDRLASAATQLRVGPTVSWETDLGPLISQQQLERAERYTAVGLKEGAALACGGHRLTDDGLARGFYYAPTVFTGVRNDMRLAQEEIFGPVVSVIRYAGDEEAIRIANDSIYGLAAGVWSRDAERASSVARRLQAGTVWVNDWHDLAATGPYGGYRQSGLGKELGEAGVLEYLRSKQLFIDQSGPLRERPWPGILGLDRIFGVRPD